jgi:hypothetical protein
LLWLRIQAIYWIRVERVNTLVSFLTPEERVSGFPYLAIGLSYIAFITLKHDLSIPSLWRISIMKAYWILSKTFCIYWVIMLFLFFILFMCWLCLLMCTYLTILASLEWNQHDNSIWF